MRKGVPGGDRGFRDPAVPGIARLLDPGEAAALLARLHPEGERPRALSVRYARYKPGRSLLVEYEATFGESALRAYAKAHAAGGASADEAKAVARVKAVEGTLRPFASSPEDGIVLFAFPNDAELRDLRYLGDPDRFKRLVGHAFPSRVADGWRAKARGTHVEILRYKPEDRCVFRTHLRWRSDRTGAKEESVLYGRVLPREEAGRVAGVHRAVCARPGGGPLLPSLEGFDADLGVLFLGAIEGTPFLESEDPAAAARRVGEALRSFRPPLPSLPPAETLGRKRERLLAYLEALAPVAPGIASHAARLLRSIPVPSARIEATVHGDFHADQVLVSRNRIAFLDLDRTGLGEPETDAASFRSHLRLLALRGEMPPEEADRLSASFDEGYGPRAEAGAPFEALSLLDVAASAVRRLEAGWKERLEETLEAIERELQVPRGASARAVRTSLGDLLSPSRSRDILADALGAPFDRDVRLERAAIRKDGSLEFEFGAGRESAWATLTEDGRLDLFRDPREAGPPATADALDPVRASALLREAEGIASAPRVARADLLSLRPHRRAVVRWTLDGATRIAKLVPPAKSRGLIERWSGIGPGEPLVPRLLGSLPVRGLLLFDEVPGRPLKAFWDDPAREGAVRATMRALRAFHERSMVRSREQTALDGIETVRRSAAVLDRFGAPHGTERREALAALLAQAPPPRVPPAALHGDFYDRQVVLAPRGPAFLDLDAGAPGDPAIDVANFAAHLLLREAQGSLPAREASRLEEIAVESYGSPGDDFERRYSFFRAASLARLASLYSIRARAEVVVPALLQAILGGSRSRA